MTIGRTLRVDPAALPAAGVRPRHDSGNEDYRWTLAHQSDDSTQRQRLQKSETLRTQPRSFPLERIPLPEPGAGPHNKPDHHFIHDIPFSGPAPRPGLTLIQPLGVDSRQPFTSEDTMMRTGRGTSCSRPPPMRETNPLSPAYHWSDPNIGVYPLGAADPQAAGDHSLPHLSRSLDTSDISGATTGGSRIKPRKDCYSSLDYSDVPGTSSKAVSPLKQRMLQSGRVTVAPIESTRLGMWSGALGGPSGNFLHTDRQPTNPLQPVYQIHGQPVADEPGLGRSRQLMLPEAAEPERRTWKDPGSAGLVHHMQELQPGRVWNAGGGAGAAKGPALRHGAPARAQQQQHASEVAAVAALA